MSSVKLATLFAEKLPPQRAVPKPYITCPEDLAAKVGTTTRCKLTTDDGSTLGAAMGARLH
ncbi:DUF4333 domain-containing protein [Streptomyces massasporeus]|uniref:DUF4333 domain-containing protein n=1 Tax=Streptomyces massasporeus TaxID=67324 RepID=UPI0037927CE1